jgi:hypothetical protein
MSLSTGKRFGLLVTAVFLVIIVAWVQLVRFAHQHADQPIPLPPPAGPQP